MGSKGLSAEQQAGSGVAVLESRLEVVVSHLCTWRGPVRAVGRGPCGPRLNPLTAIDAQTESSPSPRSPQRNRRTDERRESSASKAR